MKRSHHLQIILALICIGAVALIIAQPQTATPTYAQVPPSPPTPTPVGLPLSPNSNELCAGDVTITGTVVDADGDPVADARILLNEVQLPNLERPATSCEMATTDENGEFAVTEFRATEWMLVVQPPIDDETLFATQPVHLTVEEGDTVEFDDPFVLSTVQVTVAVTLQDGTTPAFAKYHLYQPQDFNGDGDTACYIATSEPAEPFYQAFFNLKDSAEPNEVVLEEYTRDSIGQVQFGSLSQGDYCLRVEAIDIDADEPGNVFLQLQEWPFAIVNGAETVDLGTLTPPPTPKRLTIMAVTEDGDPAQDAIFSAYKAAPPAGGVYGKTDESGTLSLDVVGGTWQVQEQEHEGILLQTDNLQAISQEVTFAQDDSAESKTITVTIVVDAPALGGTISGTISGTVRKPDGSPAIGAEGTISLSSGTPGADDWKWHSANIDPETAAFEIDVAPGSWDLGYSLHVYSADDEYASYKPIGGAEVVTVADDSTVTQDMTLIAFDSTLRGVLLKPDGTAINEGRVWVSDGGFTRRPAEIIDGVFETQLLSGIEYKIAVDREADSFAAEGLGLPAYYRITAEPNSTNEIELRLRTLDSSISGTVYREDMVFEGTELVGFDEQPIQGAKVYAREQDGPGASAITDENGRYTLAVPSGTTWAVRADWGEPGPGNEFYATTDSVEVTIAEAQAYELDLTVRIIPFALPPELEETFDVTEAWSGTLSDGTVIGIPAGAVPVDNLDGDDVLIIVRPVTSIQPLEFEVDVMRYGYEIQLINFHTGEPITSRLNEAITITYTYSDALLSAMNADQSSIGATAQSADSQTWEPVASVNHDESVNTLNISLDQAATAAVTVRPRRDTAESQTEVSLFLPVLVK